MFEFKNDHVFQKYHFQNHPLIQCSYVEEHIAADGSES